MDWKSRRVRAILERALIEDKATQDITTALTIDRKLRATGTIVARQPCVLAGLGSISAVMEIFSELAAARDNAPVGRFGVVSHPEIFDGVKVKKGQPIAVIRSNATALFSTERVMLNLLQRMCGIATLTDEFVRAVAGTKAKILDTRKTVPGLRVLDRYAVCCGGGHNHRHDLEDGISIKANHSAVGGGLAKTLSNALKFRNEKRWVQVEVRTQAELDEAIAGGAESILLNYMTPAAVKKSVKQIHAALPGVPIEAAGSITLANVKDYAAAGVDFVAVGALTTAPAQIDLSLKITANAG